MLHYAPLPGTPDPLPFGQFRFEHVPFVAPFGSLDYLAAIKHCVASGAGVIIIDSMTHEHIGEGGYLPMQETEMYRMAADDYAKRERVKFASMIKPSKLRSDLINGILQLNSNFIFCFRAKEKIKPVPGKQPVELGFMPIAGAELLFEMTVNCLLLPKAGGIPTWRSDHIGEKLMMKCPLQFERLFANERPLDEETGRDLAEWARGGMVGSLCPIGQTPMRPQFDYLAAGNSAAEGGMNSLGAFWKGLSVPEHQKIGQAQLESWKRTAAGIDDFGPRTEVPAIAPVPPDEGGLAAEHRQQSGAGAESSHAPASDPKLRTLLDDARAAATNGATKFRFWVGKLSEADFKLLEPHIAVLREAAAEADAVRA